MLNQFSRTELIFGRESMERFRQSHIAGFGIGGSEDTPLNLREETL